MNKQICLKCNNEFVNKKFVSKYNKLNYCDNCLDIEYKKFKENFNEKIEKKVKKLNLIDNPLFYYYYKNTIGTGIFLLFVLMGFLKLESFIYFFLVYNLISLLFDVIFELSVRRIVNNGTKRNTFKGY